MKKITNRQIPGAVRNRQGFRTDTVLGMSNPEYCDTGYLDPEWRKILRADEEKPGITYVVYSYATPIAWVCADGTITAPQREYGVTTSRHQRLVREGLDLPFDVERVTR